MTATPPVDRAQAIRWLEGKLAIYESETQSCTSKRKQAQAKWNADHARAALKLLQTVDGPKDQAADKSDRPCRYCAGMPTG